MSESTSIRTFLDRLADMSEAIRQLERRVARRFPVIPQEPSGSVKVFLGPTAPSGYYLVHGQALSTTTDADLFAVIGYTYGGAGATFYLPDFRGRVPVGLDGSAEFLTLGAFFGTRTHTLTVPQIPNHRHWLGPNNGGNVGFGEAGGTTAYTTGFGSTRTSNDLTSGNVNGTTGQAHNNIQPSIATNFIVKR